MNLAQKIKKLKEPYIQTISTRIFKTKELTESNIKFVVREELDKFCDELGRGVMKKKM